MKIVLNVLLMLLLEQLLSMMLSRDWMPKAQGRRNSIISGEAPNKTNINVFFFLPFCFTCFDAPVIIDCWWKNLVKFHNTAVIACHVLFWISYFQHLNDGISLDLRQCSYSNPSRLRYNSLGSQCDCTNSFMKNEILMI